MTAAPVEILRRPPGFRRQRTPELDGPNPGVQTELRRERTHVDVFTGFDTGFAPNCLLWLAAAHNVKYRRSLKQEPLAEWSNEEREDSSSAMNRRFQPQVQNPDTKREEGD